MKICIICQVQNSFEYIPAWLAYHSRLADHIYLIDHNSDKDLRGLDHEKLTVFSSKTKSFEPDINTNVLLEHKGLREEYDWIFVLDIDEFLPFSSSASINQFCRKNRWHACVSMFWKNGYAKQVHSQLDAKTNFDFQTSSVPTRKLCYNTRIRKHFWIRHGNHAAQFPLLGIPFLNIRPWVKKYHKPLYHIPFINISVLIHKLENLPTKSFKDKIYRHAQHLDKKYGPNWHKAKLDNIEKLWLVSNYRMVFAKDIIKEDELSFEHKNLLNGLDDQIQKIRKTLSKCAKGSAPIDNKQNLEVIKEIHQSTKKNYKHNISVKTRITADNTIELVSN